MSTPAAPLPFLGDEDLARFPAGGTEFKARRGEILIQAGETTTALLLIMRGNL